MTFGVLAAASALCGEVVAPWLLPMISGVGAGIDGRLASAAGTLTTFYSLQVRLAKGRHDPVAPTRSLKLS